jgi:hypothetical protein
MKKEQMPALVKKILECTIVSLVSGKKMDMETKE